MKIRSFLLLSSALITLGCGSGGGGSSESAPEFYRVINAAPDAGELEVTLEGETIADSLEYGNASAYIDAPEPPEDTAEGEESTLRLRVRSDSEVLPLIDEDVTITPGESTSAVIIEEEGAVTKVDLEDDFTEPDTGLFKLRIVTMAENLASADVYLTLPNASLSSESPTVSAQEFKAASEYLEVDEGSYRIRVTAADSKTSVVDTGTLEFVAGKIYTLVIFEKEGGGNPRFGTLLVDN